MTTELSSFLDLCERAARAGGAELLAWRDRFGVWEKAPADMVTDADLASQEAIRRLIAAEYPDHDFLGEEGGSADSQQQSKPKPPASAGGYRWIVDPLDGTTNYVHHIPEFAVSVALTKAGQSLVGTVFHPLSGDCFTASRGGGAFLNGRPMHVSRATELAKSLVAVSFSHRMEPDYPGLLDFQRVVVACQSVRRTGSSALNLCYLAAGRFDAFWARDTKVWDVAAGWLLVEEAGGVLTDLHGEPPTLAQPQFIAAATEPLHRQLRALIR